MPPAIVKTRKQALASIVPARLRRLVASSIHRGGAVDERSRPYSFLSECACPHDCLRDHENE